MNIFSRFSKTVFILFLLSVSVSQLLFAQDSGSLVRTGMRSSYYGFNPFPDTTWWYHATTDMAGKFEENGSPAKSVIWIIGGTRNNGCYLSFPNPNPGTSYQHITFDSHDNNEKYLDFFDRNGFKVWLQIEPGLADIETVIDLVLSKYSHHKSVIGFGIDVEWYKTSQYEYGKAVTDAEAEAWSTKIKSFNEDYLLFTKHWLIDRMPPTFRDDIVFVDDSQSFPDMESMIAEFVSWAEAFTPAKVAYQYGYNTDQVWWQNLDDPPKGIGEAILKKCPNTADLFWVDFTAYDIWPKDYTTSIEEKNTSVPTSFSLNQNYPNPFNPSTTIEYTLVESSQVELKIYNVLGNEVAALVDDFQQPGNYQITWNTQGAVNKSPITSGIYFYKIKVGEFLDTKKMLLVK